MSGRIFPSEKPGGQILCSQEWSHFSFGKTRRIIMIKEAISLLVQRKDLSSEMMSDVMEEIMTNQATDAQKASFLTALAMKGETIGIIGGTGSGKTSLINLIPRFYDVRQGEVLVDGVDVKEYPFSQLRGMIGIVPQKAVLFKGTIRHNMQWRDKNATDEDIWNALDIAQAKDFVEKKPDKLDEMILQEGKNLSGGQRQRLTIARALVGDPEILILDDSASALDLATDARLRKAIHEKTSGMTVFIVSQRISSIKSADKIIVLDDGKIAGIGTHSELYNGCEVYKEICLSQLSEKEAQANG